MAGSRTMVKGTVLQIAQYGMIDKNAIIILIFISDTQGVYLHVFGSFLYSPVALDLPPLYI